MTFPSRRSLIVNALALAAGAAARAQVAKPNQLITLIVPYPTGRSADATMRSLQPILQRVLNQTVIVENLAGASGTIGVGKLSAAPADGSALLLAGPSDAILAPLTMSGLKCVLLGQHQLCVFDLLLQPLVARQPDNITVQRQVAVAVVVAMEEAPLLLTVQRAVGRVELQHQFIGRRVEAGDELLHQNFMQPHGGAPAGPLLQPA